MRTALVIGGTGPTGPHLVDGLLARGLDVTVFHTGRHELDLVAGVPHIHGDPFSAEGITEALAGRSWDVVVATYGRVRLIAQELAGRCNQLLVVGGVPVYKGYTYPDEMRPAGMRVPATEEHPLVDPDGPSRGAYSVAAIRRTEDEVFALAEGGAFRATYFRYPTLYGPRNPHPWEWSIVKRVVDGRGWMFVPDDGRSLHARCGARNAAHAILLAVDHPEEAANQAFNVADSEQLSMRGWAETVAQTLGADGFAVRSFPGDIPSPGWALVAFRYQLTPHCVVDLAKLRTRLGYDDALPVREGLAETATWLAEHAHEMDGHPGVTDPFDYAAEDHLLAVWEQCRRRLAEAAAPFGETVGHFRTPQTAKGKADGLRPYGGESGAGRPS
jgi:nucleoside-diphosphate-sugar epimerase